MLFVQNVCFEVKDLVVLTLLHLEQPKFYGILAVLSALGLKWQSHKSSRETEKALTRLHETMEHIRGLFGLKQGSGYRETLEK